MEEEDRTELYIVSSAWLLGALEGIQDQIESKCPDIRKKS